MGYWPFMQRNRSAIFISSVVNARMWDEAAKIYATLRQNGSLIDDADILIAAYSIVSGFILVTANTRHFGRIEGLQWVNWTAV